jgi:hypothetical protein
MSDANKLSSTAVRAAASLLAVVGFLFSPLVQAAAGKVVNVSGPLFAVAESGAKRVLAVGSDVEQGDTLITAERTYARVKFADQGEVTLRPDSQFAVQSYRFDEGKPAEDNVVLGLFKGALRTVTGLVGKRGNRDAYTMKTATATIGIRGTAFGVVVCPGSACQPDMPPGTYVNVTEGRVGVSPPPVPGVPPGEQPSIVLAPGEFGYVPKDGPPQVLPQDPGMQNNFQPPSLFGRGDSSGGGDASQAARSPIASFTQIGEACEIR